MPKLNGTGPEGKGKKTEELIYPDNKIVLVVISENNQSIEMLFF